MLKIINKYFETILFIGIIIFFFLLRSYSSYIDDKIALGLIVLSTTIYFGLLKYRIENDRVFKQLFDSFNERYSKEFNDLIKKARDVNEYELILDDKNIIIDYFNLCAEEYLWYERGRIPYKVWISWRSGILENLKVKQVRKVYDMEMRTEEGSKSYYGLEKELKSYLSNLDK